MTQHTKTDSAMKALMRGKFIVENGYIKKEERSQNNILTLYLTKQEKLENKPTASRGKEIKQMRVEINERTEKEKNQRNQKLFLWKEQQNQQIFMQITKIRNEVDITSDIPEIKGL